MSFVSLRSSLETNTFSPTHIHQSDYAKIRHSTREYFNEKYVNKKLEFYKAVDIVFWRQWEILDQGYCYEYFLCYTEQIELVAFESPQCPLHRVSKLTIKLSKPNVQMKYLRL